MHGGNTARTPVHVVLNPKNSHTNVKHIPVLIKTHLPRARLKEKLLYTCSSATSLMYKRSMLGYELKRRRNVLQIEIRAP